MGPCVALYVYLHVHTCAFTPQHTLQHTLQQTLRHILDAHIVHSITSYNSRSNAHISGADIHAGPGVTLYIYKRVHTATRAATHTTPHTATCTVTHIFQVQTFYDDENP